MTLLEARRARLALIEQVEGGNGQRYRALALYLQVLRDGLLCRVQQACFHLATQVYPQRYGALPERQRHELHARLRRLVHRCGSLLTVEQLAALAHQQARDRIASSERRQRRLLQTLQAPAGQPDPEEHGSSAPPEPLLPEGSIRLDLDLPLRTPLGEGDDPFQTALASLLPDPASGNEPSEGSQTGSPREGEPEGMDLLSAFSELLEASLRDGGALQGHQEGDAQASAQDSPGSAESEDSDPPEDLSGDADRGPGGTADPFAPGGAFDTASLWNQGRIPSDPLALLLWFDGIEAALERRLRNLSHAINVDLLRIGLTRSLLPLGLLDAILRGQVDTLPASPNLVRLALPVPSPAGGGSLESIALLLRVADLELELPALRTCRRRLQQLRQEDRRMAEQFRRLERRVQVLEAEALWLEDSRLDDPAQTPPAP
ncbi:MAG: hypothetical protein ACOVNL_11890 [Prochlorococcaceae cyanobacterium]|jgi:hypothetical protein